MSAVGRPAHFNVERYLDAVSDMVNADEVERALWMLDNLPAYFRDNPPPRLTAMREQLHRRLWTPIQYRGIYDGHETSAEFWPLRAQKVEEWVRALNEQEVAPHVMELAPGGQWIAQGLKHRECKFSYQSMGLDPEKIWLNFNSDETAPVLFCAFEIIEHLANEWEIYQNYLKFNREADVVMLSTPLYTYAGGMDKWETRDLGHLRTYTPREFHATASRMFTGREWTCIGDDVLLLTGVKK